MHAFISNILALDQHLISIITHYGTWAYALLFLVIFCETGLVVTPFLPGDSLLFIAGSLSGNAGSPLNVAVLIALLFLASFLGNQVNYGIGRSIGQRVFGYKDRWFLRQSHLKEAHQFYERHGKITLILARFMPVIRTFVPFVAGVAAMTPRVFIGYNAISALIWIGAIVTAGYFLGQFDFIQAHLSLLIYGIVLLSLLPSVWVFIRKYHASTQAEHALK